MTDETAWNDHSEQPGRPWDPWRNDRMAGRPEIPGVVNSGLFRTAERDALMRQHARRQVQLRRAARLGTEHGRAGTTPYGDLDFDDDSPLFTALGETGPTTEDNHPRRVALLDAYRDAWTQAGGQS